MMARIGFVAVFATLFFIAHRGISDDPKDVAYSSPVLKLNGTLGWHLDWQAAFRDAYDVAYQNLQRPKLPFSRRHAYPNPKQDGVYLWDSAFIAEIWKVRDPGTAREILLSAVENQSPDGRLPGVVNLFGPNFTTQPPVLAWAVNRYYQWTLDRGLVAEIYPRLKRFHAWLKRSRRLSNGLYRWDDLEESRSENNPRFSGRSGRPNVEIKSVAAIDLSSYMAMDAENLSALANVLGKSEEASAYLSEHTELRGLINELLWDSKNHFYFDRNTVTGEFITVKTIYSFLPLVAGVAPAERAGAVVNHLMDAQQFNALIPFLTVARNENAFSKDGWRGPVSVPMAYLTILGLVRYGFMGFANQLSFQLVDGIYRTWSVTGHFYEFYDPDQYDVQELSRKRGNLLQWVLYGNKPIAESVGATGLVNNILVEQLMGIRRTASGFLAEFRFPDSSGLKKLRVQIPSLNAEFELIKPGRPEERAE